MTSHLKIDFVSDVSCPWCAIGLFALDAALRRVQPEVTATLHFQPFELNPQMLPGGQDIGEHLNEKYGSSPEQQRQVRDTIRQRGASVGFEFSADGRGKIYNTFDAHRLLHWAATNHPDQQHALKVALLQACHRDGQAMDQRAVLVAAAQSAGLDSERAGAILDSGAYAQAVREQQAFYTNAGVRSVPAIIINNQHLISGGQPVEVFEQALRQIAAQSTEPGDE
jgi:predicted DsbA family dithiol-disulfide isomerase